MLVIASVFVLVLKVYGLAGLVYGLYFITFGLRGAPVESPAVLLRLMLLPAALLLWPLLLWRKSPYETRT